MRPGFLRSIVLLPGTILIIIPALLLWIASGTRFSHGLTSPNELQFWLGALLMIGGLILAVWTARLQVTIGKGTPAPWDPPTKLVVWGPYRYVRNPMIVGAFCILLAESLLFQSWPIAGWLLIFVVFNLIYIPIVEEKELEERFGEDYRQYKAHVPRWIPRWRLWADS